MPSIVQRHHLNYLWSLANDFVPAMVHEINANYARVVRIHVSGDFYSHEYIRKWTVIVRRCPQVRFFAYTRSWRKDSLFEPLLTLSKQRNVQLWFSEDSETGPSPPVVGIRRAFLVTDSTDEAAVSGAMDLVFRDTKHVRATGGPMKRINETLVCPHENGTEVKLSCSSCKICFSAPQLLSISPVI